MQSSPIVGFSIDDHQIRGLMRSRESKNEDDVQVTGVLITKVARPSLKEVYNLLCFEIEFRKSRTIKSDFRTVDQLLNQMLKFSDLHPLT